ncbi:carbohydrate kinase family protein [Actinacidiphila acidipaludis]|uniref:Carbohydrate kinase n=1 Tax=Actinacidiphila acidipaludis TaxID=2873382 RepID=A0ABS7QA09_9ACTN|nr:carbohydrate kinase [Streptomyces acidipaludis]MBY8879999.1 carbohydrate kinase [Streptomyces acidipaludis]
MTTSARITVVGETLVDLVWHTGTGGIAPHPGGSPANVAIGLRRLGHPVALITCWGDDAPGGVVAQYLAGTGLEVVRAPSASGRTTVALAYVDDTTGSATYDFLAAWDPRDIPVPDGTVLLHTGSLAAVVAPGADAVVDACRRLHGRPGTAVAVDLNVRPAVQPDRDAYRAALLRLVGAADIVKASEEDLEWLYPGQDPGRSARDLLGHGPRLAVLTRGPGGATGFTADAEVSVPAPATAVADTIGAGDAFQSALLAAVVEPGAGAGQGVRLPVTPPEVERVLRQAVVAGAIATTRHGAQPPHLAELRAALALDADGPAAEPGEARGPQGVPRA